MPTGSYNSIIACENALRTFLERLQTCHRALTQEIYFHLHHQGFPLAVPQAPLDPLPRPLPNISSA